MPTRNYRQLDELPPSWLAECPSATTNQHTAPHPSPAEADSSTFSPTQDILTANQAFSTHSAHHKNPSQALKTHRRHTAQQPSKTHPTRPKHPLTSTKTQSFAASIVGQTPRFRTTKRTELSALEPCLGEKGAIKWNQHPKPHKSPHPHHFAKHKNNSFTTTPHNTSHNFTLQQIVIQITDSTDFHF